jgi:cellulose synthase (UDP-forming)
MRFEGFLGAGAPVAIIGCAIYLFVQRWLCDPCTERGLHWRNLVLKLTCWPVFFAGTLLAIVRADIPYVPTSKEAVRGRFIRLAWPQLALIGAFIATVFRVGYTRMMITPEAALQLSAEAVWGMLAFATLPVVAAIGSLYAAWEAREPLEYAPWNGIDVDRLGGRS